MKLNVYDDKGLVRHISVVFGNNSLGDKKMEVTAVRLREIFISYLKKFITSGIVLLRLTIPQKRVMKNSGKGSFVAKYPPMLELAAALAFMARGPMMITL
jgi:hypothetical protein